MAIFTDFDAIPRLHPDEVRELVEYDPETGHVFWKPRPPRHFEGRCKNPEAQSKKFNGKFAGKRVGAVDHEGYLITKVCGVAMKVHRIAYAVYHGKWPDHEIDHVNGDPSDNRINNLRDATPSENNLNMSMRADNTSGVCGVSYSKSRKKWCAQIQKNGVTKNLGRFEKKKDAISARKQAEAELGFSATHGRNRQ